MGTRERFVKRLVFSCLVFSFLLSFAFLFNLSEFFRDKEGIKRKKTYDNVTRVFIIGRWRGGREREKEREGERARERKRERYHP